MTEKERKRGTSGTSHHARQLPLLPRARTRSPFLWAGAGNQVAVVLLDVLHMLIAEDAAVLLKLNPVNE